MLKSLKISSHERAFRSLCGAERNCRRKKFLSRVPGKLFPLGCRFIVHWVTTPIVRCPHQIKHILIG
jgi:hypothetical protein